MYKQKIRNQIKSQSSHSLAVRLQPDTGRSTLPAQLQWQNNQRVRSSARLSIPTSCTPVHVSPQLGLPSVLSSTPALYTHPSKYTVVDYTPAIVNGPQSSIMTGDRRDLVMPLYTVPPAA